MCGYSNQQAAAFLLHAGLASFDACVFFDADGRKMVLTLCEPKMVLVQTLTLTMNPNPSVFAGFGAACAVLQI